MQWTVTWRRLHEYHKTRCAMCEGLVVSFVDTSKELLEDSDFDLDTNNCDDNTELVLSSNKNK